MKRWLILVVVVGLLGGGYWLVKKRFAPKGIEILETAKVRVQSIQGILVATGIIKPQVGALVKIGARATGVIEKMNVRIGDHVHKGQLIALIDPRETLKALEAEQAALEGAVSSLEQVEKTFPEKIKEAKANYEFARVDYSRERALLKKNYTTRNDVDRAKSKFDAAAAVYARLQDEYQTELKIAKAKVAEITARVEEQKVRLSYTRIYAPIDGIVSEVTAQEGETIVTGLQVANLVSVLDPTRLELWVYVDETDVGKVAVGQRLTYYVDTYPNRIFSGVIERVRPEPVVKDNIVYYLAIVKVNASDAVYLRPEMTSYVRVVYAEKQNVLAVPNSAIKFEHGNQVVYLVKGPNKVEKLVVQVGLRGEDRSEIISGLKAGMEVATRLIFPAESK